MRIQMRVMLVIALPLVVISAVALWLYFQVFHNRLSADPVFVSYVGGVIVAPLSLFLAMVNLFFQQKRAAVQEHETSRQRNETAFASLIDALKSFLGSRGAKNLEEETFKV